MSNPINDGGPAFPVPEDVYNNGLQGMTLRDYFAAKAMQGMVSSENAPPDHDVAKWSYTLADAMLAARDKKEGES